jgi:UDP-N-acetylglucosamine 4,6-dehydratase/5-epimerase
MKYLITGGTGSLGKQLLKTLKGDITIMSRSETAQIPLKAEYPDVKFILGDVRDPVAVRNAMKGAEIVIHAAAFKFLDVAETQSRECALTNVLGSINVIDAAVNEPSVKQCIGISTDKVVSPENVYGCTKHIMEKLFKEAARNNPNKKFACARYGNVRATTGSVLTVWERQKAEGKPLTITDKRMRRFFFSVEEAVDLIINVLDNAKSGEIYAVKMPSYSIYDMAKAISDDIVEIGMRPGEKLNETLVGAYEGEEFTSEQSGNNEVVIIS